MSFQAYLDNIQAKTGKNPEQIVELVRERGLAKPGEVVAWLKREFDLGHGHAMAIVALMRRQEQPAQSADDKVARYSSGPKAKWRGAFDRLLTEAMRLGSDVAVSPGATYVSLVKAGRKFAIVQAGGTRLNLGLRLKGEAAAGRLEDAGTWSTMLTHRVRIADDAELDDEVAGWLGWAYAKA
jgi:hypothetical protein